MTSVKQEKPPKPPWGRYGLVSCNQWTRFHNIGRMVRIDRKRFENTMAPDPEQLADAAGELYWGSTSHIVETAIRLLEEKLCRS